MPLEGFLWAGSQGHCCPGGGGRRGGEAGGLGPTLLAPAVGLCPDLLPLPAGAPSSSHRDAQEQRLPRRCPPVLPHALLCPSSPLSCHRHLHPFTFSALVLFLFHFPFVFSAVLS